MSTEFPDEPTIHGALSLAVRAPSMQNSQPWRWQVGKHTLHLYADGGRGLPDTDFGRRALLLSCGAALNHCIVGLAAFGWQAKIHRLPDTPASDHLAAIELHRYPAAEADVTLAAAIPRRRTDRRRYSEWPVPRGDLALMGARAARAGVTMRRVEAFSDLANLVAQSPTPVFAGSALLPTSEDRLSEDNGVVVALGTTYDDAMAHLRAGEATSVVLLTATALGLASCPDTGPLEEEMTRELVRERIFDVGGGSPQMLLRIGWAPVNADPLPSTPRHDLADVVEWLDDDEDAS